MLFGVNRLTLIPAVMLIAISSTFLGLFIAVSVSDVLEAQTQLWVSLCLFLTRSHSQPRAVKPARRTHYGASTRGGATPR